jgi:hypothetical protein
LSVVPPGEWASGLTGTVTAGHWGCLLGQRRGPGKARIDGVASRADNSVICRLGP